MTDSWLPTFAAQLLLLVLIVGALSGCLEADPSFHVASVVIAPTDTSIRYIGRTQADGSEAVRFDWAGSGFVVRFAGTGLGVRLDDGANDFNIDLNGVRQPPLATEAGRMAYTLAEGLPDTVHTVRFTRRTEPGLGITTLRGLVLPPGGRLLAPPEAPGRRLLFVGDSITCGYGVEGDRPDCDFSRATEHADAAYAAQAARAFGAEAHLIAQSGLGVVRNYGAPTETSPRPMPSYLDQALFGDEQARWEAAPWRPDAVVINLGTNDFSTTPHPSRPVFLAAYGDLLTRLRSQYSAAPILVMAGPLMAHPAETYLEAAVAARHASGDAAVGLVRIPNTLAYPADFGCDGHPNRTGQRKIAGPLIESLAEALGWVPNSVLAP